MSTLEKLIAAGMEKAEAGRIAAMIDAAEEAAGKNTDGAQTNPDDAQETAEESAEMAEEAAEDAAEAKGECGDGADAQRAEENTGTSTGEDAMPDVDALISNLMAAEVRSCALECGVDAKRLHVLMRLTDTTGIDPKAENLHDQVMAAVKAALKDVPELSRSAAASGSLGDHMRTTANTGKDDIAAKFRSGF